MRQVDVRTEVASGAESVRVRCLVQNEALTALCRHARILAGGKVQVAKEHVLVVDHVRPISGVAIYPVVRLPHARAEARRQPEARRGVPLAAVERDVFPQPAVVLVEVLRASYHDALARFVCEALVLTLLQGPLAGRHVRAPFDRIGSVSGIAVEPWMCGPRRSANRSYKHTSIIGGHRGFGGNPHQNSQIEDLALLAPRELDVGAEEATGRQAASGVAPDNGSAAGLGEARIFTI
mmetsp:Transcript_41872/g.135473  ORF Transcript_41872/g.135473 Transcript_41872/m.135473 type:complete len:236 (+) Transcript_41872:382-1089(+)